jgi:peptide/nickel transport system ATP-binding protein
MYAGEIVEYGTLEQTYNNTSHPYTKGLFNSIPNFNERVKRLNPINGLMPDPSNLPPGCNFADRCPDVMDRCRKEECPVIDIGEGHLVKCFKYNAEVK